MTAICSRSQGLSFLLARRSDRVTRHGGTPPPPCATPPGCSTARWNGCLFFFSGIPIHEGQMQRSTHASAHEHPRALANEISNLSPQHRNAHTRSSEGRSWSGTSAPASSRSRHRPSEAWRPWALVRRGQGALTHTRPSAQKRTKMTRWARS